MYKLKEIELKIDEMRTCLSEILENRNDPLDPDVIAMSQLLDEMLNHYHQIIIRK